MAPNWVLETEFSVGNVSVLRGRRKGDPDTKSGLGKKCGPLFWAGRFFPLTGRRNPNSIFASSIHYWHAWFLVGKSTLVHEHFHQWKSTLWEYENLWEISSYGNWNVFRIILSTKINSEAQNSTFYQSQGWISKLQQRNATTETKHSQKKER